MLIELIYERGCPNISLARRRLRAACLEAGLPPRWVEWSISEPECPDHARRYGSPTILIEGRDALGEEPDELPCCRLYRAAGQLQGAPTVEQLLAAIEEGGAAT